MGCYIIRAAIMFEHGGLVQGKDYGSITALAKKISHSGDYIRGYVLSDGEFIPEEEAYAFAKESGQLDEDGDIMVGMEDLKW